MHIPGDLVEHGVHGLGQVVELWEDRLAVTFADGKRIFMLDMFEAEHKGHIPIAGSLREPRKDRRRQRKGRKLYKDGRGKLRVRQPWSGTPSGKPCPICRTNQGNVYSPYANGEFCSLRCSRVASGKGNTGRKLTKEHKQKIAQSRKSLQ
jgi:hypothetical protein